tara:strand:- start:380 stop:529 length:150 start_codon:yes stop_codon:yes gene_type:complete
LEISAGVIFISTLSLQSDEWNKNLIGELKAKIDTVRYSVNLDELFKKIS